MKAVTLPREICWETLGKRGMAVTGRDVLLEFPFKNQLLSAEPRTVKDWKV